MNKHSYLAGTAHMRSTHPAVEEADSPLKETERHHHPEHSLRNASTGPFLRRRSYDFLMMHGHFCLRTLAHAMLASAWNTLPQTSAGLTLRLFAGLCSVSPQQCSLP